ncbi:hypothetical protein K469DRAFT_772754 [Zopfia rhizophila CBS 207.26]|uniref:Uncharacterized protein n=1 Tax=Zopfia rhizophila CBS 207.26 TaxID=1314779 RepID=A0A6A6E735_9PEZI|nr:hypothetical protein K469DRAFT_772754 [Zopfia rhizophila CBS 207.26]
MLAVRALPPIPHFNFSHSNPPNSNSCFSTHRTSKSGLSWMNPARSLPGNQPYEHGWLCLLLDAACESPVGGHPSFQKLHGLFICMPAGNVKQADVSTVIRLPSLRDLHIESGVESHTIEGWDCPEGTSNVQCLTLSNFFMASDVAAQIISSCKPLTLLDFVYDNRSWHPFAQDGCRSLRELKSIDESDPKLVDIAAPNGHEYGYLGSILNSRELRYIYLPMSAFLDGAHGIDHFTQDLPHKLQVLYLRVDIREKTEPHCADALINLYNKPFNTMVANLDGINIFVEADVKLSAEHFSAPKGLFTGTGIPLSVKKLNGPNVASTF